MDVARPPRRVARISGCHGTEMRVCAEVSLDLRDRRSCMCSLSVTVPWWRSSWGRLSLQRAAPRRDTTLVTTTLVSAACFSLLSHVVKDGSVSGAFVYVLGFVRVVMSASARYIPMLFLLI
jgi:hypothetical protein